MPDTQDEVTDAELLSVAELEAKPCPFCGGVARQRNGTDEWPYFEVVCDECGACGPERDTPLNAVDAWNGRSLGTSEAGVREALRAADDALIEAEAVLGGEYADTEQVLYDRIQKFRDALRAAQGRPA